MREHYIKTSIVKKEPELVTSSGNTAAVRSSAEDPIVLKGQERKEANIDIAGKQIFKSEDVKVLEKIQTLKSQLPELLKDQIKNRSEITRIRKEVKLIELYASLEAILADKTITNKEAQLASLFEQIKELESPKIIH